MAADIDVRAISTFSALPEATINSLAENPTVDLVKSLLQNIEKKVKEFEQSKSQKVKLEVELETVVRTNESKTKVLQNSRDKALADVTKLREDLQKAENARARAEADLEGLRQSTTHEATEVQNLRARISSLEASNRDTLSLLESKSSAYDRLSQELSAQHEKLVELRRNVSSLEQANQQAASTATSAKFKQASLEQELELQRKNIDWYENERKIKADEHQNFRKEKNARVTELQRSNEQYIEQAESLQRSESAVKHQLEEQIKKNDELISELEKLREEHLTDTENHRMEVENISRLAQLQQASAENAKQRVQDLSNALEEAKEEAADEVGRIRAEIQNEHSDRLAAEERVAELESRVGELEAEVQQAHLQPATPRRDVNGANFSTPQRPGTPLGAFTPRSTTRAKPGMSVTQLYSAYTQLERELASEKRANEQLQAHVDSMLEDLEASKPEIEELRSDQSRLQSEVFEMSSLVENANQERNAAAKEARLAQGHLEALNKQLSDAQQALRDRNSQLRRLLLEQRVGTISDIDYERLQHEAASADQQDMEHLSETQQGVNRYLIAFKNIEEMQTINENQLTTIRNLAAKLESEQAQERQQKYHQMEQDLEAARVQNASYQDELRSMVAQSKSFAKERDMLRSMVTRKGGAAALLDPTDFSRSMPLPSGGAPGGVAEAGSAATGETDYGKALRDLQMNFDNYRQETSTDTASLRKQVSDLSQRNNHLQLDTSRAQGQLTAANQRYEMLQTNFNMLKTENSETQKRSWAAMEAATKQELKTQETAEQLVEARGMLESFRRESANLKAEKDLWKNVEKRLIDDNESLRNDRIRLEQLNTNLQNLLNEREHSDSEIRRRLQSQAESLESELQTAKRKLEEEVEDNKKSVLRREYDHEQSQKRIDDLFATLSNTREELSAAKTARDHLQARVDEMTVELRSVEERLEIFTRPATDPSNQTNGAEEATVSREQELVAELSELRRDLELKTSDLERANEQIDTFKSISQEAEDRLQGFMETQDQFKTETEAAMTEKDTRIKDLQQRIDDISSELNTTNTELSRVRDEQGESDRRLDELKTSLEGEIARLKEAEEKALEQAAFNTEATKVQAQIATDAQQNYEAELVKHAEAAKNLQTARSEANQLRLDLAEFKSKTQNAQNDLEQKQTSWTEMESRYKQELEELKKRREELVQQNGILHGQLEQLTQQITALQRDRATTVGIEDAPTEGGSSDLTSLQEVIKYLRREKEIVEVQYHLSTQEAKRLKQQYDFAQTQLDETRLKLDQQRRAEVDLERSAMSHNKLMETLNELNLYRESSVTLRNDLKHNQQAVTEKTKKIEELENQIQPLQERVAELENLCELREGEMKLLQDDRNHWQQRTQNILSKYDRVDPAELESLKSQLSELEVERDGAVSARDELQVQVDGHADVVEAAKTDLRNRLQEQFKTRSRELSSRVREKQAELDTALEEKTNLESELQNVRQELEQARGEAGTTAATAPPVQQDSNEGSDQATSSDQTQRVTELEGRVAELEAAVASKDEELAAANTSQDDGFKNREAQMREVLNKRLAEVKKEAETAKTAALDELRQTLEANHQEEIENLRAQSVPVSSEAQQPAGDQTTPAVDSTATFDHFMTTLTEAQAKLLVQKNETVNNIVKSNIKRHVEREKEAYKQQLASEQPSASTEEIASQVQELEKKFAEERESIIKQKDEEFAAEKAALIEQHEQNLEAEKKSIQDEQQKKVTEEVEKAKNLGQGKLNMFQSQLRGAQAKLGVVKKAAEETPEKAVKEVWEAAKVAKPVDAPRPAAPVPTPAAAANATATAESTNAPATEDPKVEPTPETNGETTTEESNATETGESDAAKPAQPSAPPTGIRKPSTGLPQPRGNLQAGRGRGAAAGTAARGTSLPTYRGGARGGRGGATGRGAATAGTQVNTNQTGAGRGGGPNSPSRGALNPAATQFTPGGTKRAREDSEGGSADGNQGKRIRGGGAGS